MRTLSDVITQDIFVRIDILFVMYLMFLAICAQFLIDVGFASCYSDCPELSRSPVYLKPDVVPRPAPSCCTHPSIAVLYNFSHCAQLPKHFF